MVPTLTDESRARTGCVETHRSSKIVATWLSVGWQAGAMSRERISQGSEFEQTIGYSRAIVDGRWVFVAGTTGFDYATMTISDDIVDQVEQTLANIDDALTRAGSGADDVVRVRYLLAADDDFEACWPSLRRYFGEARPAATMMVVGLQDPRMKIEIEVTALKPAG